jgi:cell division septation protein DedD
MSQDPYRRSPSSQSSAQQRGGSENEWLGEDDPLAELARLVGHPENTRQGGNDLYASGRQEPNFADIDPPGGWAEPAQPATNESDLFDPDQPYEEYRYPEEGAEPEAEERAGGRRSGSLMIMSVLGIVVLGTVGVTGYRFFSGSSENGPPPIIKADGRPSKEVPAGADASPPAANKQSYDRATDQARVVEPEEPAERPAAQPRVIPTTPAGEATAGNGEVGPNGVRRVRTFVVRPDGSVVDSAEAGAQGAAPAGSSPEAPATAAAAGEPAPQNTQGQPQAGPQSIDQLAAASATPAGPIEGEADGPSAGISFAPGPEFGIMAEGQANQPDAPAAANSNAPAVPMPAPRPARLAAAQQQPQVPQQAPQQQAAPQAQAFAQPQAAAPVAAQASRGGFVVQISSQRTEADARSTFDALKRRFPQILGSYQPSIQPANLGDRGTYYRVRVGPFASRDDATGLCANLKTAGGDCVVQAN